MDNYLIDSTKLMFHPFEVSRWLNGKDINPIYIEVSPVDYCNSNCNFCGLDFKRGKNKLDFDKLSEMLLHLNPKSVMFGGAGEPTLYPQLPELIKLLHDNCIDTALTTNFVLINYMHYYLKYFKWIKISINGGDRESYNKIHRKDDFDKVIQNMKDAVKIKKDNDYTCTIGAQIVLLPENYSSIENLIKTVKEIGLDYIVLKPYSQHLKSDTKEFKDIKYAEHAFDSLIDKYNDDNFKVIIRKNSMDNWNNQWINFKKCYATPDFWGYIEADGNYYSCSCHIGDERFIMGNINTDTPKKISNNREKSKNLMETFDVKQCRVNCRMARINEYLERLKNPLAHQNFI